MSAKEKPGAKTGVRREGSWRAGSPATDIPDVPVGNRGAKVEAIAQAMRDLSWRSSQARQYAEHWSVSLSAVQEAAAEAHRLVAREVEDPARATSTVVTYLESALASAFEANDLRAIGDLARTWSTIVGAVAPQRLQVSAIVADLGKLSSDELRAQAMTLAEAVSKRLALAPVLVPHVLEEETAKAGDDE